MLLPIRHVRAEWAAEALIRRVREQVGLEVRALRSGVPAAWVLTLVRPLVGVRPLVAGQVAVLGCCELAAPVAAGPPLLRLARAAVTAADHSNVERQYVGTLSVHRLSCTLMKTCHSFIS